MAARPLSDAQADAALAAFERCGGNLSEAARQLNISRSTMQNRINVARSRKDGGGLPPKEASIRDGLFKLAQAKIDPPKWTVGKKSSSSNEVVPILFASDFQWGETIRPEELDGINGYDSEIARVRLRRLFERAISICESAMAPSFKYPGVIYARGGDMVSGDIHQELRETNELSSIPAVIDLVKHEIAGINMLVEHFGKVHVISVCGNHGRSTEKPMHKRFVESNYDTLSAYMIEAHFAAIGEKRVTFSTPSSGDALFSVYGWKFLLTHGDRIGSRGGEGFIGPVATISRGMKKTFDYYASLNRKVDYILVGHFHTALALEYGYSNGCLSGFSEYARTFRMRPNRPSQWLLLVNQSHGVMAPWQLFVEDRPAVSDSEQVPWAA